MKGEELAKHIVCTGISFVITIKKEGKYIVCTLVYTSAASENVSPKLRQNCRSHSQLIVAQLVHLLLKNICRKAMDYPSKLTVD